MKRRVQHLLVYTLLCGLLFGCLGGWFAVSATEPDITETTPSYVVWYQDNQRVETPIKGQIYAEVGVVNYQSDKANLSLLLAVYDANDCLKQLKSKPIQADSMTRQIYTSDTVNGLEGDHYRLYLWTDSIQDITPLPTEGNLKSYPPDTIRAEKNQIAQAYAAMDREFIHTFDWLVKLYDPVSGGFYTTVSGAEHEGYTPSLEATAFVCQMLTVGESGAITAMPKEIREKLIAFFQSRKSADGFYYDTGYTAASYNDRDRIRVHDQCVEALNLLEATVEPQSAELSGLWPPKKDEPTATLPSYCDSVTAFMEYIESLDWDDDSWSAGDLAYEAASYFQMLTNAEEYQTALLAWLDERQDAVTGYWGQSGDYGFNAVSGAFKVSRIYNRFGLCPPRAETILKSIQKTLKETTDLPNAACYIRNPISTIQIIKKYHPNLVQSIYRDEEELFLTEKYKEYIHMFFRTDGGASSYAYYSRSSFGGIPAGMELCEGDIDGTRQLWITRKDLNHIFDREPDATLLAPLYTKFWNDLSAKEAIVKKSVNAQEGEEVKWDFNRVSDIGDLYAQNWSSRAFGASLETKGDNQFLTLTDMSPLDTEELKLSFPRHTQSGSVQCRIKFDRNGAYTAQENDLSYTYIKLSGNKKSIVEIHAIDQGGDTLTLKVVTDNSNGNTYQTLTTVTRGRWVDVMISYEIQDGVCQTAYTVNGVAFGAADGCTTGQPCIGLDQLSLVTSKTRLSKISIDDLVISGI